MNALLDPKFAVIPILVGPLQVLMAMLPAILLGIGSALLALFKPATFKLAIKLLWRVKVSLHLLPGRSDGTLGQRHRRAGEWRHRRIIFRRRIAKFGDGDLLEGIGNVQAKKCERSLPQAGWSGGRELARKSGGRIAGELRAIPIRGAAPRFRRRTGRDPHRDARRIWRGGVCERRGRKGKRCGRRRNRREQRIFTQ